MNEMVNHAKTIAHLAHAGQKDKAGMPYIEHVARVAALVAGDPEAEAVAWLHDVLEDCTEEYWSGVRGFSRPVAEACEVLNRKSANTKADYYRNIRRNPLALKVKLADIADNSDAWRMALLPADVALRLRLKYREALDALTGPIL